MSFSWCPLSFTHIGLKIHVFWASPKQKNDKNIISKLFVVFRRDTAAVELLSSQVSIIKRYVFHSNFRDAVPLGEQSPYFSLQCQKSPCRRLPTAGANEIAIYSIDTQGRLTMAGRQSVLGKTPRNFAIDPTGNYLLAANQDTNEVIIFKRDQKTGLLTPTGKKMGVDKPVCLKFVAVGE